MSVEPVERKNGRVWRVRWRDDRGRPRSRVIGRKKDADAYDADIKQKKRLGDLGLLEHGTETLDEFYEEWWDKYAVSHCTNKTRLSYASMYKRRISPVLGSVRLRQISAERVDELRAQLGPELASSSINYALSLLGSIMQRATEWDRIPRNPVRLVRKPSSRRSRLVRPLSPAKVEALRVQLSRRDGVVISVLAYAGLRPGELRGLQWKHVQDEALVVEQAISLNEVVPTKTGKGRRVALLAPVAQDLKEWFLASGRPEPEAWVFPDKHGGFWRDGPFSYWGRNTLRRAFEAVGFPDARPYDLRHSFVSLLIQEKHSIYSIAMLAGHTPTKTLETYTHLFEELDPSDPRSAEDLIAEARAA